MKLNLSRIDPHFTVLFNPKFAYYQILERYSWPSAIVLFLLYGLAVGMDRMFDRELHENYGTVNLLIFSIIIAPILGVIVLTIWSVVSKYIGKLFGGCGTLKHMFAASWALCPSLYFIPISYFRYQVMGVGSVNEQEIVDHLKAVSSGTATQEAINAMTDDVFNYFIIMVIRDFLNYVLVSTL